MQQKLALSGWEHRLTCFYLTLCGCNLLTLMKMHSEAGWHTHRMLAQQVNMY